MTIKSFCTRKMKTPLEIWYPYVGFMETPTHQPSLISLQKCFSVKVFVLKNAFENS